MHSDQIGEFLTHMAVLKHQKSALEMAWRPSYEKLINKNTIFRYTECQHGIQK